MQRAIDKLIKFLDLQKINAPYAKDFKLASARVIERGWYLLGEELESFEAQFADYVGAQFAIGVSNGLDALVLVLQAWGIKPGDEVIVPAHTFIATWLAVSELGATPIPVDVCPDTYCIDVNKIEGAINAKTKAIIPVHLYGQPADMQAILALASKYGIPVLEDAAQAHGAKWFEHKVGSIGTATTFSFYPGKNLGALGDAGAVTTNDAQLALRLKSLRNYGSIKKYQHDDLGRNCRMDELQAAFLKVKLPFLKNEIEARSRQIRIYESRLSGLAIRLPLIRENCAPVWHLYVVQCEYRDDLQRFLFEQGIETLVHYPTPPHLQTAYHCLGYKVGDFPMAERLARRVISLPIGSHLLDSDIEFICKKIALFFNDIVASSAWVSGRGS
ncbi:DegT/DnrJ/EryC1/StrS aminotransferase family protein [Chitinibacter tainanensis]|uniref:DegT/DnrJ/EryC1/StrS family aminotransferase n=1 Tax=Chitinibacter tainanensis TaxID=230667 RepID=UPI00235742D2|nr:DegT/DnrJ/EryC1/StrS family aminotransferase [Chitinibacter tainanensis]